MNDRRGAVQLGGAGGTGENYYGSAWGRSGRKAVLTSAALLMAAAAPVANAANAPAVAPPEPLVSLVPPPAEPPAAPYWQVVIEQELIIRVPAQMHSDAEHHGDAGGPA